MKIIGTRLFSVLAFSSTIFATNDYTFAQVIPDNTLGRESSTTQIDAQFPVDIIEGGAIRGTNLFHSFSEFNVSEGRGVYFLSPSADIQNILARVIGSNPSTILGTIGTFGNSVPNLFLINPNGIIFGANASLDMGNSGLNVRGTGGSFVATTANAVILGDTGGIFSASNPSASNLLNIAPSALFFNSNFPAEIANRSSATTSVLGFGISGLQVPNDRSLILAGGKVTLNNGQLNAAGGNVELGGVTEGTVGLNIAGNDLSLSYPNSVQPADVLLTNSSIVSVLSSDGGNITINARNINILPGSGLLGGISPGGDSIQDAGDITLNASENIVIAGRGDLFSFIFNDVNERSIGNGGDISLQAESIFLNKLALNTTTSGQGNGGNVIIQANNSLSIDNSLISGDVFPGAVGKGGNINIQAGSLSLTNNSKITTNTSGEGDAGSVFIQANNVALDSSDILSSNSGNLASILIGDGTEIALGNGGNIQIVTGSLSLNNAILATGTLGLGNGGNVFISATDLVSITGDSDILSGVLSSTLLDVEGVDGELIDIIGAAAVGNGGDISIEARSLSISGKSLLATNTSGLGDAGNISLRTSGAVTISDSTVTSGVFSNAFLGLVGADAAGQGGNLNIVADSLTVDNATLFTSTAGQGSAGSIFVQARDIFLTNNSRVSSAVQQGGVGDAGNINLETNSLYVTGGSQIRAAVERERDNLPGGQGKGGSIQINASETVDISGVNGNGFSGGIITSTDRGASGTAGNIIVNTTNFRIADGAIVSALTANSSDAGSITINANDFTATGGGQVLTTTSSSGRAGSINLNIISNVEVIGSDPTFANRQAQFGTDVVTNQSASSGLFANTSLGSTGGGGSIFINAPEFSISEGAGVSVDSQGQGNGGNLQLQASSISLDRGAFLSASTASGEGGNINIEEADLVLLRRNSNITTAAGGTGNGGNISIDTTFIVAPASEDSNIIADAIAGNGGNIDITTQGIFGITSRPAQTNLSDITASSELGIDGAIAIDNPDVDPSQGLVALPVEIVDATNQIASGCTSDRQATPNKFTVTGRGGLPPNPSNPLASNTVLTDWATLSATETNNSSPASVVNKHSPAVMVEAQGWMIDSRGRVVLTALAPQVTPNSSKLTTSCNGL